MAETVERRLSAILSADVASYARLMRADEDGTLARFRAHRTELVEPKIAEYKGRIAVGAARSSSSRESSMPLRRLQQREDKLAPGFADLS